MADKKKEGEGVRNKIILLGAILLGACFRFTGINWDEGHHLQPDERYISMVLSNLTIPKTFREYIDPTVSSLSPYTHDFGAYIYGQFPLTTLTYLSTWFGMHTYDSAYLLGRFMSGLLDVFSIILIWAVGRKLWNERVGAIASAFYACLPLAIQYSHYMVMESWTTFFLLATLLAILRWKEHKDIRRIIVVGILFGISCAIKANAILFAPLIIILMLIYYLQNKNYEIATAPHRRFAMTLGHLLPFTIYCLLFTVVAVAFFRFFQPTIFNSASWLDWSLRSDFLQAFKFQQQAISGKVMFPPQWQWVGTTRWMFPLKNLVLWGMGPVIGLFSLVGIVTTILKGRSLRGKDRPLPIQQIQIALAVFVVLLFFWQEAQFVKTMRYLLPALPLYCLFAASLFGDKKCSRTFCRRAFLSVAFLSSGLLALAFTGVYRQKTTRVQASEWMVDNIPSGSSVMLEEWDDPLPLSLLGKPNPRYDSAMVQVYAPDNMEKEKMIAEWLKKYDWIVLSSHRAKGSIGKLPDTFPLMSRFYKDLESGTLGFVKVAEFTSYPSLEIVQQLTDWKLEIDDSSAEEAFWVYDHPTVEIYKKQ